MIPYYQDSNLSDLNGAKRRVTKNMLKQYANQTQLVDEAGQKTAKEQYDKVSELYLLAKSLLKEAIDYFYIDVERAFNEEVDANNRVVYVRDDASLETDYTRSIFPVLGRADSTLAKIEVELKRLIPVEGNLEKINVQDLIQFQKDVDKEYGELVGVKESITGDIPRLNLHVLENSLDKIDKKLDKLDELITIIDKTWSPKVINLPSPQQATDTPSGGYILRPYLSQKFM
jgi:hypothetical protein